MVGGSLIIHQQCASCYSVFDLLYLIYSLQIPLQSTYNYPHFADVETESEKLRDLLKGHTAWMLWSQILNPVADFRADDQMPSPSNHAGGDCLITALPLPHFVPYVRENSTGMAVSSWTYLSQTTYSFQDRKGYPGHRPLPERGKSTSLHTAAGSLRPVVAKYKLTTWFPWAWSISKSSAPLTLPHTNCRSMVNCRALIGDAQADMSLLTECSNWHLVIHYAQHGGLQQKPTLWPTAAGTTSLEKLFLAVFWLTSWPAPYHRGQKQLGVVALFYSLLSSKEWGYFPCP